MNLFPVTNPILPLASKMRPRELSEIVGQQHLLAKGKALYLLLENKTLPSLIFWGPPGTGKTTLARILAQHIDAHFEELSAVFSGIKDVREAITRAQMRLTSQQRTILFIDEIHRFNKSQQDAFLPYIENGTIILIGATTENPSFELNSALLSRTRIFILKSLNMSELMQLLNMTLCDEERGLGKLHLDFAEPLKNELIHAADGDARRLLTFLEIISQLSEAQGSQTITPDIVREALTDSVRRFDKKGEHFYNQISALHKSVRGSNPDAALYWLCRMLDGGCDPLYLCRRIIRIASEDIGLADPRALEITLNATQVYERLGSPEGELALAEAVIYLACAAKSNAVYIAFQKAMKDVKKFGSLDVPLHLCNAPTSFMKKTGYGQAYRYAHDEPHAYAAGETYFPNELKDPCYYQPSTRGLEKQIQEKLAYLKQLDLEHKGK